MGMKYFVMLSFSFILLLFSCHRHKDHQHTENHVNQHMHQRSFDDLAKGLEDKEREEWQKPGDVIALLGDISGKTIMDIGAGTGYFSFRMAEKGAHVIAADVSDEFQDFIEHKKKELRYTDEQLELRKVPFDSPDLKKMETDAVLIVNTYHHIEGRIEYFNKVLEGLKKEGVLMVVDFKKQEFDEAPPGPPIRMKIKAEQVVEELREAGFNTFDINASLLKYQYIILAKK